MKSGGNVMLGWQGGGCGCCARLRGAGSCSGRSREEEVDFGKWLLHPGGWETGKCRVLSEPGPENWQGGKERRKESESGLKCGV